MLVVMQQGATDEQIQAVIDRLVSLGFTVHRSTGVMHTVLGGVGPGRRIRPGRFRGDGRRQGMPSHRFALQACQPPFQPQGTVIKIGKVEIGGPHSCDHGRAVQRGKPRSDRESGRNRGRGRRAGPARRRVQAAFLALQLSGHGRRGPEADARRRRPSRPAGGQRSDGSHPDPAADRPIPTSCRWARATCRTSICCAKSGKHPQAGAAETRQSRPPSRSLLLAAEYIMSGGNYDVILCERGIRTFETYTRNTMDISAIPVVKKLSHLPIVGDPSHGTGRRDHGAADGPRRSGRRSRRPDRRSASRSRSRLERRRANARPRAIH